MSKKEFLSSLAGLLEVDDECLLEDKRLEDFSNWDSLVVVSMIALIDQYFGVFVSGQEIAKCATIRDVFSLIDNKKASN